MSNKKIFEAGQIGNFTTSNRIVMAPMTRSRANADGLINESAVTYYGQRAEVGLIIVEGTQPSLQGQGYNNTPGIYNPEQVAAWKKVTDEVHAKSGKIFVQLMHAGRMNHPENSSDAHEGLAPSAVAPENSFIFTPHGRRAIPVPREMTLDDIERTIGEYAHAAKMAIMAGFDGVEVHGANGYLIHEFFGENTNLRSDNYGGSVENKARFAIEVTKAVVEAIGSDKVGFRISPFNPTSTIDEGKDGEALYRYLVKELADLDLAYLHILHAQDETLLKDIRQLWTKPLLLNRVGRSLDQVADDLNAGLADFVSIGTWILANPDFPTRLKLGAAMNEARPQFFFGGSDEGYIDYPFVKQ